MSNTINPQDLAHAIEQELTLYHESVTEGVAEQGRASMKKLVKLTKASAPQGKRGSFKRNITSSEKDDGRGGRRFIWHVKGPDARLTHLIVNGHATKDGGRTKSNPFLADALATVLPEYEKGVEEVLQNGK